MSSSAPQIAGEPVKYEDLPPEHKKRYDELKAILEADLIGAFEKTRSHGIKFKGFQPEGALDGLDLSLPSDERTRALRQEVNYAVAHSLHRHAESLVNTLERVALNVVQEVTKHKYSPSGPALGTHQGEVPLYTRPPLQHTFAAPQQQGSPAYVVYKEGGDPGDYQFLYEPPKEVPHGYVCTYVPDCNNWMTQVTAGRTATAGGVAGAGSSSGADAEKQAWLTKYATSTSYERSASAAPTVDEITAIMRDKFGILPKKRMIGYSKPYPNDYDLIPLPPKYRLPDFTKFSGSEGTSSIEHVSRYLAQLGMVSASDELRVRFFSQSLTGPAFGWYTSLLPVRTWKQLEEQFHEQYHSETTEASLADLTQVRQRRGETVSEYIQRFRTVRNRCYSVRLSEKEAVELAIAGLSAPLRDVTFQAEYNSLAHMVQKLTAYEQRHPELYQDKYKRVALIETDEDEDSAGDQEVAVAEWTRGAKPVSCKWVKQPGPMKGFDFDLSKTEQIFDLLLKEKQLKLPEGHKIPTPQEMNGKPYCKWHHTFTHTTNDCKVLRGQIQMAIEQGRLLFGQFAMRVDTQPFPEVNMVDLSQCIEREPGVSRLISMWAGLADRHGDDKPESSRSRGKDKKEADPRDRPQHDDRRYLTEEEVISVRYQRPLSAHLLNKYEQQYDRRRRYDVDDDRYRRSDADNRKYRRYEGLFSSQLHSSAIVDATASLDQAQHTRFIDGCRGSRSAEWERSKITNQDLNLLKKLGISKKPKAVCFPSEESYPTPPMGYRVSFVDHLIRGLSAPIHPFLRGLLYVYGLQLHHLTPNSILHISIFITLCEAFLGVQPNWALWKRIFFCRRNGSANVAYNIGGVVISVRSSVNYFDVKLPDSVQGWRKKWLYIREENHGCAEDNIPPFDGAEKILRRRSWDAEATEEERTSTEALMTRIHELQNTRGKELSGIQITAYFLRTRVQPLQARKNPFWNYAGDEDTDRLSTNLEVKDLDRLIRKISSLKKKDSIPSTYRVKPYSATNALPKEDASEATASAQSPPPAVSPKNKRKRNDAEDSGTSKPEEAVPSRQKAAYDPYLETLISSDDEEEVPTADVAARTNRTSQEFELEDPDNDPLLDAVSFLEFHGTEAREGMDEARAGLSRLFPYFFPKKEEPATFLGLAKCFNPPEDLGLKMRHENMKVAVESTVALVADSQQTIDWAKVGDTEQIEQTKWRSLIKAAKLNTKKILAYLGIKPSSTPSSSKPEV
ncbi:hypothetical protein QYE76_005148 [Lolium multiflorum]|uniref:Retrotransposon gag protein n=1 Tax=Lolium multiflorum TaxID=4521 RepID=A0AAD8RTB6_LOLMU|nr:hypothetical protein QYE76_005148 [Lolium multiflorum]